MKKIFAIVALSTILLPLAASAAWTYQYPSGRIIVTSSPYPTEYACDTARRDTFPAAAACTGSDTILQSWVYDYRPGLTGAGTPTVSPPRGTEASCLESQAATAVRNTIIRACYNVGGSVPGTGGIQTGGTGGGATGNISVSNGAPITYTLLEPIVGFLPTQAPRTVAEYLAGFFRLTIALAGLLAVIRITWCGFSLMMSVSPSAREEAKECIKLAIFGLLLALGSFFIINSIGLQSSLALPGISSGGGGPIIAAPVGSPICTLRSSNTRLFEGQTTDIVASCLPAATAFIWTSSNGAPVVQNAGGFVTFSTAGVYTYTVAGRNVSGTGVQSAPLSITVSLRGAQACAQDMPQEVTTPITCAQTNTQLNWSAIGPGERSAPVVLGSSESLSVLFTTAGAGAYGFASTSAITVMRMATNTYWDPDEDPPVIREEWVPVQVPANINSIKYANISRESCDFRYENLGRAICAVYGNNINLRFQVGGGTPPGDNPPGCILEPNTAYRINIRNEDPTVRGLNTCPLSGVCEFNLKLFQSQGSQFTPEATAVCATPPTSDVPPPILTISSPANNTAVLPGQVGVSYSANAPAGIESLEFSVYNLQTGALLERRSACIAGGRSALCSATTTFPALPSENSLRLSNSRTGNPITSELSCSVVGGQNGQPLNMCSASFQLENISDRGAVRIFNAETGQTITPNVVCVEEVSGGISSCTNPESGVINLTVGPGQGSYRIVATVCGSSCVTEERVVVIANPCGRGQVGLSCFEFPNGLSTDEEICAPQNGLPGIVAVDEADAYHVRLAQGERARLIVANRPMTACPTPSIRFPQADLDDDDYVWTMAAVDIRATANVNGVYLMRKGPNSTGQVVGGSRNQGGYRWRQVRFSNYPNPDITGWVYEHLLQRIDDPARQRGDPAVGSNWCSITGMASTSLAGTCDYVRNETLQIAIGTTPGDTSGVAGVLGQASTVRGRCGTTLTGGSGHFEITLKTTGTPGPNECVLSPDTDYYVNVGTGINNINFRPRETQEEYVVLFSRLPPSTP